jgi:hypothetical protein
MVKYITMLNSKKYCELAKNSDLQGNDKSAIKPVRYDNQTKY